MKDINIYCEDCNKWLSNNTNIIVDHIICDLPYFQVVKDDFDNQWQNIEEYIGWFNSNLQYLKQIIKPGGNFIVFCSRQNMWRICQMLYENGFEENRTIIWARKRGFNNTRGKALASGYEPILFWSKGKSNTFNNIKIKVDSKRPEYTTGTLKDGITLSDVWTDIPALLHNAKEKVDHPTQKPIKLMERIVSLFTNEGDTILDFCMGSGSTGIACQNLNRKFIGIEKDKKYFDIAIDRLDNIKKQIQLTQNIFNKTIGFELSRVKAMSDEESWEWHKKHARINEDGTMTISADEIGNGSFEKEYKKPYKRN